jgi:hypothetical protein
VGIPWGLLGNPLGLFGTITRKLNAATRAPKNNIKGLIVIPPVSGFRSSESRKETNRMIGGILYAKIQIDGLLTGDATFCMNIHLLAIKVSYYI